MSKEIELKPGYDPDKYRDKLCEQGRRIRETMSSHEYIQYINEEARKSPLFTKFENEDEALKPSGKKGN
ncbi:MAG: hypothetical protein FWG98_08195 [Candidatus Cloacimonetes bacterium]|nr:hypothetical protein [Candidatus Cloacimonadota bacterium]